ncbi:MAG TPA: DNA alkylation repair protein [Ignavibacteria bacterium]|nr:DNA alkylation repair protein [Ignavibacteria bacterium]
MLLKDYFNENFYIKLCEVIKGIYPDFKNSGFIKNVLNDEFRNMELKERMRHTTLTLRKYLPEDINKSIKLIVDISTEFKKDKRGLFGLEFIIFPDFIEIYGIDNYELSIKAMEEITKLVSCEFAVRPFILRYEDRMVKQMMNWSKSKHHSVRRLSSEGIRPRLPWGIALPVFKKNPTNIFPILENLINDENFWVRKSVANNLNDISKDNPELVLKFFRKWKGKSEETDKIIKHASRTLLKKGDKEILKIYGLNDSKEIVINKFIVKNNNVRVGEKLNFTFDIKNKSKKELFLRLEYAVYFRIKNGNLNKKVFKISEKNLLPGQEIRTEKFHNFKQITTRKYYTGEHKLGLIINGIEKKIQIFNLKI